MNHYPIPLFPLNLVICPGGLIPLRIFEARYLDMVKNCLRNQSSFAIVSVLPQEHLNRLNSDSTQELPFANIGTVVEIVEADVTTVGLIMIRCVAHHRIKVDSFIRQSDGLLIGEVSDIANDAETGVPDTLKIASSSLQSLLESLPGQGVSAQDIPVIKPYEFDNPSWVANRWVELLDLPLLQKQQLMQMDNPILRLGMIHDILGIDSSKSL